MIDNIAALRKAVEKIQLTWAAEKQMLEQLLLIRYLKDDDNLRLVTERRFKFYADAVGAIQKRIEELGAMRVAKRSDVDKVVVPLLESVFGEKGP